MAMTTKGSGLVPGPVVQAAVPSIDMVVTYRAIYVGGAMYSEGDRVKMTDTDARTAEAIGRARRYVVPSDAPPSAYIPEPEGESLPAVEKSAGKKKRIGKLAKDGG